MGSPGLIYPSYAPMAVLHIMGPMTLRMSTPRINRRPLQVRKKVPLSTCHNALTCMFVVPWIGDQPGYVVMLCQRGRHLHTARSLDDRGTRWEPLNDTGLAVTPGPTPGVRLHSGRLAVAAYGQILLSDDGGRAWRSR